MQPSIIQLEELIIRVLGQVWATVQHSWPFLVVSILIAAAMKLYLKTDVVAAFLRRHEKGGVLIATAAAVGTPLCSCGTTAIVLGMMAGSMPWAPIVAFMVASPLTSPEELIYSAGLFGWPFAIAFFAASIVLGLAGGAAGTLLDARGWLRNQSRFDNRSHHPESGCACDPAPGTLSGAALAPAPVALAVPAAETWTYASALGQGLALAANGGDAGSGACCRAVMPVLAFTPAPCGWGDAAAAIPLAGTSCCCSGSGEVATGSSSDSRAMSAGFQWRPYLAEVAATARRLVPMFLGFVAIGYLINGLIPPAWIASLFGSGHAYSVPLAATLGLPFYVNSEASLPLVSGMLNSGMSAGAALAFLIDHRRRHVHRRDYGSTDHRALAGHRPRSRHSVVGRRALRLRLRRAIRGITLLVRTAMPSGASHSAGHGVAGERQLRVPRIAPEWSEGSDRPFGGLQFKQDYAGLGTHLAIH